LQVYEHRKIEVHRGFDDATPWRLVDLLERRQGMFGFGPGTRIYLAMGSTARALSVCKDSRGTSCCARP